MKKNRKEETEEGRTKGLRSRIERRGRKQEMMEGKQDGKELGRGRRKLGGRKN